MQQSVKEPAFSGKTLEDALAWLVVSLRSPEPGRGAFPAYCRSRRVWQPHTLTDRYTMWARIAGCPCRTVLRGALAGVGQVSKRGRRRCRGDPRLPSNTP